MKKIILTALAVFAFSFANAQETKFGVKAGLDLASATAKVDGISASASETGFFIGGFVDVAVSDKFHVQPEVLYVAVKDLNQIHVPILAKYAVSEGINILAGPSLGFILDKQEGMKSLNYGVSLGAGYDITENIVVDARYDFGMANLIEDGDSDFSYKLSGIFIGVGYKF